MALILDGKAQAAIIKEQVQTSIKNIPDNKEKPCMAIVQVGDDPASTIYIRQKEKACNEVGMTFKKVALPEDITQEAILAEIDALNNDPTVSGFMVQQPLPSHLDADEIVERTIPHKDVDCLHPHNVGLAAESRGSLLPCTPAGVMELLDAYNINLGGKHCVVMGCSRIVGKPLGLMMLNRGATVTYCHSRTENLPEITKQADVLAVAIGSPKFVTADMIKPGCVLIDVGINRIEDGSNGNKICGDVDYEDCLNKTSYITPVPGGVGPMTVAMLVLNGLKAWENQ